MNLKRISKVSTLLSTNEFLIEIKKLSLKKALVKALHNILEITSDDILGKFSSDILKEPPNKGVEPFDIIILEEHILDWTPLENHQLYIDQNLDLPNTTYSCYPERLREEIDQHKHHELEIQSIDLKLGKSTKTFIGMFPSIDIYNFNAC